MNDDDPPNNSGYLPDYENQEDPYLAAILKTDYLEETGKINYEEIFANRDKKLKGNGNGK